MTLVEVLMTARQAGLTVRAKGDVLRVTPANKVTPALIELLREHKPALLALLRRRGRVDDLQEVCPRCGDLHVDLMGHGLCFVCIAPMNREVA